MKTDAEILARHFLLAAIWADSPEDTQPRETRQAREKAKRLAWQFIEIIGPDLVNQCRLAWVHGGYGRSPDCGDDRPWLAAMGHDFWLTCQGHGVGFWDREELKALGIADQLTAAAKRFHVDVEFHGGWVHLHARDALSLK